MKSKWPRRPFIKIEDAEIVLMEQAEAAQKEVIRATLEATAAKKLADSQIAELGQREENFKKELAELQQGRAELAAAVDESARNRYDRILKSKGDNAVVGIDHGVCGGCHMKLQQQLIVMCQAQKETGDLLKLRPDFVLHARHGIDWRRLTNCYGR